MQRWRKKRNSKGSREKEREREREMEKWLSVLAPKKGKIFIDHENGSGYGSKIWAGIYY